MSSSPSLHHFAKPLNRYWVIHRKKVKHQNHDLVSNPNDILLQKISLNHLHRSGLHWEFQHGMGCKSNHSAFQNDSYKNVKLKPQYIRRRYKYLWIWNEGEEFTSCDHLLRLCPATGIGGWFCFRPNSFNNPMRRWPWTSPKESNWDRFTYEHLWGTK